MDTSFYYAIVNNSFEHNSIILSTNNYINDTQNYKLNIVNNDYIILDTNTYNFDTILIKNYIYNNLDAITKFTKNWSTSLEPVYDYVLKERLINNLINPNVIHNSKLSETYTSLELHTKHYIDYLVYKKPKSIIYSFGTYNKYKNVNLLNNKLDLINDWSDIATIIQTNEPLGIDSVIGNSYNLDIKMINITEIKLLSSNINLLLHELLLSVLILHNDGVYITKMNEIKYKIQYDFIYLCTLCFESISIYKLVSDSGLYIICNKRKPNLDAIAELISSLLNTNISNIFETLPDNFINYVNNLKILINEEYNKDHKFNIQKLQILWNV